MILSRRPPPRIGLQFLIETGFLAPVVGLRIADATPRANAKPNASTTPAPAPAAMLGDGDKGVPERDMTGDAASWLDDQCRVVGLEGH
jgi:hypothetical protein